MSGRAVIRNVRRSGQEYVTTSEIACKTNWGLIGGGRGGIERTEITEGLAKSLGFESSKALAAEIQSQNRDMERRSGIVINNVHIQQGNDGRIFLVVNANEDLRVDLSRVLDMGLTVPVFFSMQLARLYEEEKQRGVKHKKKIADLKKVQDEEAEVFRETHRLG